MTSLLGALAGRLDAVLGRFTTYRLVASILAAIALVAIGLGASGRLDQNILGVAALVQSFGVIAASAVVASMILARLVRRRAQVESSIITALILWFMYWPGQDVATLGWLALLGVLAGASKFIVVWRGRHLVNPAAAGSLLLTLVAVFFAPGTVPLPTWWIASDQLVWVSIVGALVLLYRLKMFSVAGTFALVSFLLVAWSLVQLGASSLDAAHIALTSFPIVFIAGFMLTEPLTLPPRRGAQLLAAAAAGVVVALPMVWAVLAGSWPWVGTNEIALLVTGLIATLTGQQATGLRLQARQAKGPDTFEYAFEQRRELNFEPGQYLELHLPHRRSDLRGERRIFSIASAPGEKLLRIGVREPKNGSSFKRALSALEIGDSVQVTSIHGDFVIDEDPVLLIAGDIGITAFLSRVRSGELGSADVRLIYGLRSDDDAPYLDELRAAGLQIDLVTGAITAERVRDLVPDVRRRRAFIAGPPAMVEALSAELVGKAFSVHTDAFLGY